MWPPICQMYMFRWPRLDVSTNPTRTPPVDTMPDACKTCKNITFKVNLMMQLCKNTLTDAIVALFKMENFFSLVIETYWIKRMESLMKVR